MGKKKRALLVGIGLDTDDGHTRVTRGDNFYLSGGKKETHERLQEVAIKTNEKISKSGKSLENLPIEELRDTIREVYDKVK